jgi:DNA-binding transcriptional LysR family regulator
VRAVIGFEDDLMPALIEGRIDLGVMYTPQARPGLRIEPLLEERLVMVTTHPPQPSAPPGPAPDYVLVDWGPEFLAQHALAFPQFEGAALSVNMGWLGLERLLAFGGSGYFPLRLVRAHERAGTLHRVSGTPEFSLPAYLCHTASPPTPHLGVAIDGIRNIAVELG